MKKLTIILFLIALVAIIPNVSAKDTVCATIDGAYYGKDGLETDKGTYEKECVSHKCDLVADAYFGKDGYEVSKSQFEQECGATVYESFPDTGSISPTSVLFFILGIAIIAEGYLLLSKKQTNN